MVKVFKKSHVQKQLRNCIKFCGLAKMGLSGMNISGSHSKRWDWEWAQWLWRVIVCYGTIFGLYSEGDGKAIWVSELVTNKINPVLKNKNKQANNKKTLLVAWDMD